MRVSSATGLNPALELTNASGTTSVPASGPGNVTITLAPGVNTMRGVAYDGFGTRGQSSACDVFLAIGSSLVVYPAAGFPIEAKRAGAELVIINREPTELDDFADLVIHADIGDVLDEISTAH